MRDRLICWRCDKERDILRCQHCGTYLLARPTQPDSLGRSALTLLVALLAAGAWGLVALLIAS